MPLSAPLASWIEYEQTVNERINNHRLHPPIDERSNTVRASFRPEARLVWPLDVVAVPAADVREYGRARAELRRLFGFGVPRGHAAIFVHPQSRAVHRRRIDRHGLASSGINVTPTASYRSLLAWSRGRGAPAVLKLSLAATVGEIRRLLHERQIARAIFVTRVLDTIPRAARQAGRLDWFPERAGVALARERHGWLVRHLPGALRARSGGRLIPAFSLISRRADGTPLLVDLIRRSGERAELFVARHVLLPYVNALAYLLLEEGVAFEGHTQNVLYLLGADGALTGGIVLRDMADASVNVALRIARGKPLPPAADMFPAGAGFAVVANAADFRVNAGRPLVVRAGDTANRYGLASFVWAVNRSLRRFLPGYSARAVERAYLHLWQRAAVGYLGVEPQFRTTRAGVATALAIDEALVHFLERADWSRRGAAGNSQLPRGADAVLVGRRATRRAGARYGRVETAWGDLYLDGTLPAFFRSAF